MNDKRHSTFNQMTFTYDNCFVCGCLLDNNNKSEEHIYPKWLQRKFDLWNQELILLNRSKISYKNLKIPCCKNCNNIMSKKLEMPIEQAVSKGYDEFIKLDKKIIFQWLNKLSYGMLFKELSLKREMSNRDSSTIYTSEELEKHKMQHLFLKSSILDVNYVNNPWSILIFKIGPDSEQKYWAYDNPYTQTAFIRMNDIGVICHLMDNGANELFFKNNIEMRELLDKTLHPIQFKEICAKFLYKASLLNCTPLYTIINNNDDDVSTVISHEMSGILFDEWSQIKYSEALFFLLGPENIDYNDIYYGGDLVVSFLTNEEGEFKDIYAVKR